MFPITDHGAHGLFYILRVMWAHFQCCPVLFHSIGMYQPENITARKLLQHEIVFTLKIAIKPWAPYCPVLFSMKPLFQSIWLRKPQKLHFVPTSYLLQSRLMLWTLGVPIAESSRSVRGLGKGVNGKPYPRLCNARRPRLEPGTFQS